MTFPIVPAQFTIRTDGTPYSSIFHDVYHSAAGSFGQAAHVFLNGNGLPRRWRARRVFTIVETGFGLSINFAATWALWRNDPARCDQLHFVSIEKHPFTHADLAALFPRMMRADVAPLADQLLAAWPILTPGPHRLEFEQGNVVLTLMFGDVAELLPKLRARADAFYLDGFAPAKNPEMWNAATCKALARLAAPDATLATYTAARAVREGLSNAGFEVSQAPGYHSKREMTIGRFAPRWPVRRYDPPLPGNWPERHAIVIGAGLAGCAVVERLAARGWRITLIERRTAPANEASGHTAGLFHPLISKDDNFISRLSRTGFLYALRYWQALADRTSHSSLEALNWQANGLLSMMKSDDDYQAMRALSIANAWPDDYIHFVSRSEAKALIGVLPASGGLFFPSGGRCDPISLCRTQLDAAGSAFTVYWATSVAQLVRRANAWHAVDAEGSTIASAPVAIIASAHDAPRLGNLRYASTRSIRGQLTVVPKAVRLPLALPVTGNGYAVPLSNTDLLVGASYDSDDDPLPRASSHADNLCRLRQLFPDSSVNIELSSLTGHVGFRCIASDRMPLVGALADEHDAMMASRLSRGAHLLDLPRQPGLYGAFGYGSHGLIWAALAGELIACAIEGEPLPIETDLAHAIDPARFLLKTLRARTS